MLYKQKQNYLAVLSGNSGAPTSQKWATSCTSDTSESSQLDTTEKHSIHKNSQVVTATIFEFENPAQCCASGKNFICHLQMCFRVCVWCKCSVR